MREIKFRAWDKKYNDFIDDGYIIFNRMIYRDDRDFEDGINTNDIVLMQYTGLKDKNSVEIYEGDIVKEPDFKSKNGELISEIEFNKYGRFAKKGDMHGTLLHTILYGEVIGNIYENPELLEQK